MHRIDSSGATADHLFTDGDETHGIEATTVDSAWLNAAQEELCAVIEGAGLALDKANRTQLAAAIEQMIAASSVTVEEATETVAGILTLGQISGTARAYTAQQYAAPVTRAGAGGSQAVDCDAHQLLSITATGALAFAAPTNLGVGKSVRIMIYSAASVALTWDAAYAESDAYPLPTATTAGKLMLLDFLCVPTAAGGVELMLTGQLERA